MLIEKINRLPTWLVAAVLVLLTAGGFHRCLDNGFTNWDDREYLTANPLVETLSLANTKEILFSDYCRIHGLSR